MNTKAVQVRGERYRLYDRTSFTSWKILIKRDDNEGKYVPAYRTGWEDGGEVEIFTVLPPEETGNDTLLLQIRIFTKGDDSAGKPPLPNPSIFVQSNIPAFVMIEPVKQRVLIELLAVLKSIPAKHTVQVAPDPRIDFLFVQTEGPARE